MHVDGHAPGKENVETIHYLCMAANTLPLLEATAGAVLGDPEQLCTGCRADQAVRRQEGEKVFLDHVISSF